MNTIDLTLALPAYNEAENIAGVVNDSVAALGAMDLSWEIIVIDNFSTDATPEIVGSLTESEGRIRLVRHDRNRHYSGSCATAIKEARGEYVAIMDSDGQALATDLPLFITQLDAGSNVVFGWRKDRKDPFSRLAISAVFNWIGKVRLNYPFHDLNCGYRMFDRKFAEKAELRYEINMANPELFTRARIAGLEVNEVVVEHKPRIGGGSSHDFWRMWKLFVDVNRYFAALSKELKGAGRSRQPGSKSR